MLFKIPENINIITLNIIDKVKDNQSRLLADINDIVLSHVFENRYTLHPRKLRKIAEEELESLTAFLVKQEEDIPSELGKARAISGIKDAALLDIFEYIYNFLLDNTEKSSVKTILDLFYRYEKIYIINYNNAAEKKLLSDQEQLRQALSSAFNRDRKSTRLNSSHTDISRMPSSA